MRTLRVIAFVCLCLLGCFVLGAHAQMYTPIAATKLVDPSGSALQSAQVCALPQNGPFSANGTELVLPAPTACWNVTNGAFNSAQLADSNYSFPQYVKYVFAITDSVSGNSYTVGPTQVSCSLTPTPSNCIGGTWYLDKYKPSTAIIPLGIAPTISGTITPGHCPVWVTATAIGDSGAACGTSSGPGDGTGSTTFAGDLSGNSTNQTVTGLKGKPLPAFASGWLHYNTVSGSWELSTPTFTMYALSGNSLGGVMGRTNGSLICDGTDKMNGFDALGHVLCGADQVGTTGGGLTSLNSAATSSQSFTSDGTITITTNATTGVHTFKLAQTYLISGSYQPDWTAGSGPTAILNKPSTFPPSAHTHTKVQITDFTHTHVKADITDFPAIPAAQVNSDWTANSGVAQILNKPTIPTTPSQVGAEPALGNPPTNGYVLASTTSGTRSWVPTSGSSTTTTFWTLGPDSEPSYTSNQRIFFKFGQNAVAMPTATTFPANGTTGATFVSTCNLGVLPTGTSGCSGAACNWKVTFFSIANPGNGCTGTWTPILTDTITSTGAETWSGSGGTIPVKGCFGVQAQASVDTTAAYLQCSLVVQKAVN